MAGPPDDVSPSELFRALCEPGPSEVIEFPRRKANGEPIGSVRIQVLTQEDHDRARTFAHRGMKQQGFDKDDLKDATIQEITGDAIARELLAMACLTVSGPDDETGTPMLGRVFRNAADLKKLRPDEIAFLFSAYLLVQAKYGPFEKIIGSPEDLNAWIKRLKEGGSEFPLLHLQLPQLAQLTYSLAERVSLLYGLLESQRPNLPPILVSLLDDFSTGTGSFGEPAASSTATDGESSAEGPVTVGQVTKVAEQLRGA